MKIFRKAISILILISIMIGACGCVDKNSAEYIKDTAISYLEQKYHKKFKPIGLEKASWAYHYDNLTVYAEGDDKKTDYFHIYRKTVNGKYVFTDNYFGILARDEYEKKISNIVKDYFPEFKLYSSFDAESFPDKLTSKSTLSDADKTGANLYVSTNIFVVPTLKDKQEVNENFKLLISKMAKNKLYGDVQVFYLYDSKIDLINRQNWGDLVSENIAKISNLFSFQIQANIYKNMKFEISQ